MSIIWDFFFNFSTVFVNWHDQSMNLTPLHFALLVLLHLVSLLGKTAPPEANKTEILLKPASTKNNKCLWRKQTRTSKLTLSICFKSPLLGNKHRNIRALQIYGREEVVFAG